MVVAPVKEMVHRADRYEFIAERELMWQHVNKFRKFLQDTRATRAAARQSAIATTSE